METQEPSEQYIEGFNKGYVLREHKPELALNLVHTKFPESQKNYKKGFLNGIEQKEIELREKNVKDFSFDKLREQYKEGLPPSQKGEEKEKE